ncbi:MAG: FadR family transcriptional regulator [Rhodospirillales bacterium]|nr:FadR family transcriptional regulator [Rhodospirillales bacterium]
MRNSKTAPRTYLPAPSKRTFSARSLHGQVVHEIGMQIVEGKLPPGEPLPSEEAWSAGLGVSRTAMREAIKVLAAKGLIESRPKTGTRVRAREYWNFLDPDVLAWRLAAAPVESYVREVFELRKMVEPFAAGLAAAHATRADIAALERAFKAMGEAGDDNERFAVPDLAFHQTIIRATGNELLHSLAAIIETALTMSFRLSDANPAGQRHSLPAHGVVLEAIRRHDTNAAREAMLALLDNSETDVRQAMSALARGRTRRGR